MNSSENLLRQNKTLSPEKTNCTTELSVNIKEGMHVMKDLAEQEAATTARFHEQRMEHVKRLIDRSPNDFITSTDVNKFLGDANNGSFACTKASNLLKELVKRGDIRDLQLYNYEHTCTTGDGDGEAYYGPGFSAVGKMKKGLYFSKRASFVDNPRDKYEREEATPRLLILEYLQNTNNSHRLVKRARGLTLLIPDIKRYLDDRGCKYTKKHLDSAKTEYARRQQVHGNE